MSLFFFFNDTATTEIYTLSLHDALPIRGSAAWSLLGAPSGASKGGNPSDRKSTRLNSSHSSISYAVFCLKKKENKTTGCSTYKIKAKRPNQLCMDARI